MATIGLAFTHSWWWAKTALDNIYHICKRQGKLKWYTEQLEDPKKCLHMIKHYKGVSAAFKAGNGPKWTQAASVEAYRSSINIDINMTGEVMAEERYLEFAQTAQHNPRLTYKQAKASATEKETLMLWVCTYA